MLTSRILWIETISNESQMQVFVETHVLIKLMVDLLNQAVSHANALCYQGYGKKILLASRKYNLKQGQFEQWVKIIPALRETSTGNREYNQISQQILTEFFVENVGSIVAETQEKVAGIVFAGAVTLSSVKPQGTKKTVLFSVQSGYFSSQFSI